MTADSNTGRFDRSLVPEPVLDDEPGMIDLYWKAWELAWNRVTRHAGAPQSPYMDEGFAADRVWIWDTCFMALFCRYAPSAFPGIESLANLYAPMHDGANTPLKIEHPDNPTLFAWTELEHFMMTADRARLRHVLSEKRYLQKHFDWWTNPPTGKRPPYAVAKVDLERLGDGYKWNACPSGMDNTPRGDFKWDEILWIDALAQQALAALSIAELALVLNDGKTAQFHMSEYDRLKELANRLYWDESEGMYYDVYAADTARKCRVRTPASYWPMLAGFCDRNQAALMAEHAADPAMFGGPVPWPSVARGDPRFRPGGRYWRGSVWLPAAYMATRALVRYGYHDIAAANARALLRHMLATWRDYEPHTIWECYDPDKPEPATTRDGAGRVRPDFCGWSALGPICMLIENVIGIHHVNASAKTVHWRVGRQGRYGVRRLRFGTARADLMLDGRTVTASTDSDFTLVVNNRPYPIVPGANRQFDAF